MSPQAEVQEQQERRTVRSDFIWAQKYVPLVSALIGPRLLEPATYEQDVGEATDLVVLRARDMRIAMRIRTPGFAERYPFDVTFRSQRDTGTKTELAKIIDGWGDWFFYGHAANDKELSRWWLCDLHVFRAALIRNYNNFRQKLQQIPNGDGTHFVAVDVRELPKDFVIASSHSV